MHPLARRALAALVPVTGFHAEQTAWAALRRWSAAAQPEVAKVGGGQGVRRSQRALQSAALVQRLTCVSRRTLRRWEKADGTVQSRHLQGSSQCALRCRPSLRRPTLSPALPCTPLRSDGTLTSGMQPAVASCSNLRPRLTNHRALSPFPTGDEGESQIGTSCTQTTTARA